MQDRVNFLVRMPPDMHEWLRQQAHDNRESRNAIAVQALAEYRERHEKTRRNPVIPEAPVYPCCKHCEHPPEYQPDQHSNSCSDPQCPGAVPLDQGHEHG